MYARCSVWKNIVRLKGKTRVTGTATSFTGVCDSVAHARFIVSRFAEWQTCSVTALALLLAFGSCGCGAEAGHCELLPGNYKI